MKKFLRYSAALTMLVLFAACGTKAPDFARYLPANTANAIMVDVSSLEQILEADGLSPDSILGTPGDSSNKHNDLLASWNAFKASGLDMQQPLVIAHAGAGLLTSKSHQLVVGTMKDANAFGAYLQKRLPDASVKKEDGIHLVDLKNSAIGWNDQMAVMLHETSMPLPEILRDSVMNRHAQVVETNLAAAVKSYFNLSRSNSLAGNKFFAAGYAKPGEIKMFNSGVGAFGTPGSNAVLALMPRVSELLEGIYQFSYLKFDAGKVTVTSDLQVGKNLKKILDKHGKQTIDLNLLKGIPFSDLKGAFAFAVDPDLLPALLKYTNLEEVANKELQKSNLNVAELARVFDGQFVVMVGDRPEVAAELDSIHHFPHSVMFMARMKDTSVLPKLRDLHSRPGRFNMIPDSLREQVQAKNSGRDSIYQGMIGDLYVFTNSPDAYHQVQSGKFAYTPDQEVLKNMERKAAAGFVDFTALTGKGNFTANDSMPQAGRQAIQATQELLSQGWFTTNTFNNGHFESIGEMDLNTIKNALAALTRLMMQWSALRQDSTMHRVVKK